MRYFAMKRKMGNVENFLKKKKNKFYFNTMNEKKDEELGDFISSQAILEFLNNFNS